MQQKEPGWRGATTVALIAALILFYRFPDRFLSGFLWAEDVNLFLTDIYAYGLWSVTHPYAGYLHVMPRVVAWLAARTSSVYALQYVMPVFALVIFCAGAAVTWCAALLLPWRSNPKFWAAAISLTPFLVPHNGEVYLSATNLQWVMAPTIMAILYLAPQLRGVKAFAAAVAIAVLVLSGPFGVLLAPFAAMIVARDWRRRASLPTLGIFGAYLAATACQTFVLLVKRAEALAITPTPAPIVLGDSATTDLLAPILIPNALFEQWEGAALLALALMALAIVLALWKSNARLEALVLLGFGAVVWIAGALKAGGELPIRWEAHAARYTFIPYIVLAWALLISAGTSLTAARHVPLVFVGVMLLASASLFVHPKTERTTVSKTSDGYMVRYPPSWAAELKTGKVRVLP